jgi:hypothetical protein
LTARAIRELLAAGQPRECYELIHAFQDPTTPYLDGNDATLRSYISSFLVDLERA